MNTLPRRADPVVSDTMSEEVEFMVYDIDVEVTNMSDEVSLS